jgi:hypothetical protein
MTDASRRVTTGEIADLLTWARRLTEAGRHADPAERAAFLATKLELLDRITGNPAIRGGEA